MKSAYKNLTALLTFALLLALNQEVEGSATLTNVRRGKQKRQDTDCAAQVVVTKVYVLVPVTINTYFTENNVYVISECATISITDAPVSVKTVITGISATNITDTSQLIDTATTESSQFSQLASTDTQSPLPISAVPTTPPTSIPFYNRASFLLSLRFVDNKANSGRRKRRQNVAYLGSGTATDSCTNAVVYQLINGQLFANTSNGSLQFGTNSAASYANFTATANPGLINTTFAVDSSNNLVWNNPNFYNNFARFCVMLDNTIIVVFADPATATPTGCLFVALSMTRISNCAGAIGIVSGPSGPSGPTGPSGAAGPTGAIGAAGRNGTNGINGINGLNGTIGTNGVNGTNGINGVNGINGTNGLNGTNGVNGFNGTNGINGTNGLNGANGTNGLNGASAFSFLGCWAQGCTPTGCPTLSSYGFDSVATLGGYNSTVFAPNRTTSIDAQCAALCLTKTNANFFGTVNNATAANSGDCYCGTAITGSTSMLANCVVCQGGNGIGECGQPGQTIAVYARAF